MQVDGVLVVRSNREDMNLITIPNLKCLQLFGDLIGVSSREIQSEHRPFLVRFDSLYFDMA